MDAAQQWGLGGCVIYDIMIYYDDSLHFLDRRDKLLKEKIGYFL
jgi:hypothetical protein